MQNHLVTTVGGTKWHAFMLFLAVRHDLLHTQSSCSLMCWHKTKVAEIHSRPVVKIKVGFFFAIAIEQS